MNPTLFLQLKTGWDRLKRNHPKFPLFLKAVTQNAVSEGTIIEFHVTSPDGEEYCSNIKLTADDMELISQMRELF